MEDRLIQHEGAINSMSDHSKVLIDSHNQVSDHVNHLLDTVERLRQSWDNWNEWTPIDQEEEEVTQLPIREEPTPPVQEQPVGDHSSRTLLDITPVITPVQATREVQYQEQMRQAARVSTPAHACSRLALPSLKGVTRIYVEDQTPDVVSWAIPLLSEVRHGDVVTLWDPHAVAIKRLDAVLVPVPSLDD